MGAMWWWVLWNLPEESGVEMSILGMAVLSRQYSAYCERLNLIDRICYQLNDDKSRRGAWHDLLELKSSIVDDIQFIDEGMYVCTVHGISI